MTVMHTLDAIERRLEAAQLASIDAFQSIDTCTDAAASTESEIRRLELELTAARARHVVQMRALADAVEAAELARAALLRVASETCASAVGVMTSELSAAVQAAQASPTGRASVDEAPLPAGDVPPTVPRLH